jgi:hypothetical protein
LLRAVASKAACGPLFFFARVMSGRESHASGIKVNFLASRLVT